MGRIIGILLAGGRSERMGGGDKCLRLLGGQSLLARAIARARPQAGELILNANGDPARFAAAGLPVIQDIVEDHAGPLAGILSALEWVRSHRPDCEYIISFATDTPFFPGDLGARLFQAARQWHAPMACAASGGRTHPVFGLWPVSLTDDLRHSMLMENMRKVDAFQARHGTAQAEYATLPFDPFFNINTKADLAQAEHMLRLT
ncbi:MAG: molybdenum cofactor guanylyltransferase MobA [Alphaproteobacteria bacterium]|nr:molybdenum cofactor guanylyltransferase MobA [Alphaproteobacteria bacterium]